MSLGIFSGLKRWMRGHLSPHRPHQLHTRHDIDAVMARERARCDRNGHEFSLVLFKTTPIDHNTDQMVPQGYSPRLAQILLTRSRAFDHIGVFDETTLCALLPDTDAIGAGAFCRSVGDLFVDGTDAQSAHRPTWTLFTYPSNWNAEDEHDSGRPERRHRRRSTDDVRVVQGGTMRIGPEISLSAGSQTPRMPIGSVEGLLAQPMPWWKRTVDIIGASCGLLALSPLLVFSSVAIKLTSQGPIIYKQRRCGLGGKPFGIWKFRTMVVNADDIKQELMSRNEQDGPAFKLKDDPRVTRIGRFLRKTSIDELPQLVNVLRGEMSLVGPRPLPIKEQEAGDRWHQQRLMVTPGLTCIWQIRGRSKVSFNEWVRMDMSYIRHRTFLHDMKLLAQTVPAVLARRGAS